MLVGSGWQNSEPNHILSQSVWNQSMVRRTSVFSWNLLKPLLKCETKAQLRLLLDRTQNYFHCSFSRQVWCCPNPSCTGSREWSGSQPGSRSNIKPLHRREKWVFCVFVQFFFDWYFSECGPDTIAARFSIQVERRFLLVSELVCAVGLGVSALASAQNEKSWSLSKYSLTGVSLFGVTCFGNFWKT